MKTIIIGAGAAGLTAAIFAAKKGNEVIILEHNSKPGKKILATGNGKCNITNTDISGLKYNNPEFVKEVLDRFGIESTLQFFHGIGLMMKDKNGYVYPMSEQAAAVVSMLTEEAKRLGVKIIYNVNVKKVENHGRGFELLVEEQYLGEQRHSCDSLILATGGKASPKSGSDGTGFQLAIAFGHQVMKPLPSLTGMICEEKIYKQIAGVRVKGSVKIYCNDKLECSDCGEIQLADYGISGIPVFNCSRAATMGLHKKENVYAVIDFMLEMSEQDIVDFLLKQDKNIYQALQGIVNDKLAKAILEYLKIDKASEISKRKVQLIAHALKEFKSKILKIRGFEYAQVTCGGVDTAEIYADTMESKIVKNLFFAGEIVDVDGICGGYNLQFAWSTGAIAGRNC